MGCLVLDHNVVLTQVILGDPGTISSDIAILVSNNDTRAEKSLQQVSSFRYVHCTAFHVEIRLLSEKAPVTTDTQTEQFGNFVKNGGTTSQL